ncbi:MAG: type I-G CRISPR-associated protein Csb2, partial [Acidimicrobiales bacterium]
GFLGVLDDGYARWLAGEPVSKSWLMSRRGRYRPPDQGRPESNDGAVVHWLRLERAIPGRLALAVAETLKAAVLDRYQQALPEGEDPPPVLHGHGFPEAGYDLASWLALPEVGHSHASGRLHGAAVVLPAGTPPAVSEMVSEVLWRLRILALPGGRSVGVHPFAGERRPWSATPTRWTCGARHWVSATPVVAERRTRGLPDQAEVARWCRHAGLPDPVSFRVSPTPLVPGGLSLRPHEVYHSASSRRPYVHVEIELPGPVKGPVILGRARHFGMGLMAPVGSRRQERS